MIVHYLNVMRLAIPPDEANPPLIIDPNAVLPRPISLERFEMVARRNTEFLQSLRGMEVEQFAPRHTFDRLEPENGLVVEQRLGVLASKRSDQDSVYDVPSIPSTVMGSPCGNWTNRTTPNYCGRSSPR